MKISQYYKLQDATHSYTAKVKGIDNDNLSDEEIERISDLAEYTLEPIYEKHGRIFGISSWYRCPELNKAVKGAINSEHILGSAVDIVPIGISAHELALKIKDSKAKYNKLILEYKKGKEWVHIQYRPECEHLFDDYTYFNNKCFIGIHQEKPKG